MGKDLQQSAGETTKGFRETTGGLMKITSGLYHGGARIVGIPFNGKVQRTIGQVTMLALLMHAAENANNDAGIPTVIYRAVVDGAKNGAITIYEGTPDFFNASANTWNDGVSLFNQASQIVATADQQQQQPGTPAYSFARAAQAIREKTGIAIVSEVSEEAEQAVAGKIGFGEDQNPALRAA